MLKHREKIETKVSLIKKTTQVTMRLVDVNTLKRENKKGGIKKEKERTFNS